jgi:hypothetical protein
MSESAAKTIVEIIMAILSLYQTDSKIAVLSDLSPAHQAAFVYRAMGEARGDGHEAVSMVIGTMMCRLQSGYGTPEQLLSAYHAKDYLVSDEIVASYGFSACEGYKYALSASIDIPYLEIPESEPRKCLGDTCFFERWVSNK